MSSSFFVGVYEFILQKTQTLIRNHFNTDRVFQFPFPTEREFAALDKCCNIRMCRANSLHIVLVDQAVDLTFQAVGKQDRGLMGACPEAGRQASDVSTSIAGRTRWRVIRTSPELAQWQNIMFWPGSPSSLSSCVRNSFCRLAASAISIKSTTIIIPISRKRN